MLLLLLLSLLLL